RIRRAPSRSSRRHSPRSHRRALWCVSPSRPFSCVLCPTASRRHVAGDSIPFRSSWWRVPSENRLRLVVLFDEGDRLIEGLVFHVGEHHASVMRMVVDLPSATHVLDREL